MLTPYAGMMRRLRTLIPVAACIDERLPRFPGDRDDELLDKIPDLTHPRQLQGQHLFTTVLSPTTCSKWLLVVQAIVMMANNKKRSSNGMYSFTFYLVATVTGALSGSNDDLAIT